MVLHECPFCHKLMAAKEVEREEADSNELTTTMHSPNAGRMGLAGFSQMIGPYGTVLYQSEVKRVLDNPSALIA